MSSLLASTNPCSHIHSPPTLDILAAQFVPAPLALDPNPNPEILDALSPVLSLGPALLEKLNLLASVLALYPSNTAPASHSPVPVMPPSGSTPDPPGLAILAPATPGPTPSEPNNPSPDSALPSLSPPGLVQLLSTS